MTRIRTIESKTLQGAKRSNLKRNIATRYETRQ